MPVIKNVGYHPVHAKLFPSKWIPFSLDAPPPLTLRFFRCAIELQESTSQSTRYYSPFLPLSTPFVRRFPFLVSREKSAKRFVSFVAGWFLKGFINFRIKRATSLSNFPIVGRASIVVSLCTRQETSSSSSSSSPLSSETLASYGQSSLFLRPLSSRCNCRRTGITGWELATKFRDSELRIVPPREYKSFGKVNVTKVVLRAAIPRGVWKDLLPRAKISRLSQPRLFQTLCQPILF